MSPEFMSWRLRTWPFVDKGLLPLEPVNTRSPWSRLGPQCNAWHPYRRRSGQRKTADFGVRPHKKGHRERQAAGEDMERPFLRAPEGASPAHTAAWPSGPQEQWTPVFRAVQDPLSRVGVPPSSGGPHTEALPVAVLGSWAWQAPQGAFCQITVSAPVTSRSLPGVGETVPASSPAQSPSPGCPQPPACGSVHLGHWKHTPVANWPPHLGQQLPKLAGSSPRPSGEPLSPHSQSLPEKGEPPSPFLVGCPQQLWHRPTQTGDKGASDSGR